MDIASNKVTCVICHVYLMNLSGKSIKGVSVSLDSLKAIELLQCTYLKLVLQVEYSLTLHKPKVNSTWARAVYRKFAGCCTLSLLSNMTVGIHEETN